MIFYVNTQGVALGWYGTPRWGYNVYPKRDCGLTLLRHLELMSSSGISGGRFDRVSARLRT